jgi:transcriptional regulator with XRE-family HTH domain
MERGTRDWVASRLAALRAQKGLKQVDVARLAGMDLRQYTRIEQGSSNATLDTVDRVLRLAFGIDFATFASLTLTVRKRTRGRPRRSAA